MSGWRKRRVRAFFEHVRPRLEVTDHIRPFITTEAGRAAFDVAQHLSVPQVLKIRERARGEAKAHQARSDVLKIESAYRTTHVQVLAPLSRDHPIYLPVIERGDCLRKVAAVALAGMTPLVRRAPTQPRCGLSERDDDFRPGLSHEGSVV